MPTGKDRMLSEWLLVSANALLFVATGLLAYSTHLQAKAVQRQTTLAEDAQRRELDRYKAKLLVELAESQTVDKTGSFLKFRGLRVVNTGSMSVVVSFAQFVPAVSASVQHHRPLWVERVVRDRGSQLSYNDDLPTTLQPGESLVRMYRQIELVAHLKSTRVLPTCLDSLGNVYRGGAWVEFVGEIDCRYYDGPGDDMQEQKHELLPAMELSRPREPVEEIATDKRGQTPQTP